MTYAEAIQFLYGLNLFGARFGLENTLKLAAAAGNPHLGLRFIHVAGTNGKGSICAMLESIYRAAGRRVGLYTSPHLVSFRERIQINGRFISEADVIRLVTELRRQNPRLRFSESPGAAQTQIPNPNDDSPTFFEFVTVMALRYFAEQNCDLIIWETGLGGRLDATNIVVPEACIITNIGIEHSQWLGDTVEKIAREKAGIIKPGIPVVTAAKLREGLEVIHSVARDRRAPLVVVDESDAARPPLNEIELPLHGPHQRLNAAAAIAAVSLLTPKFPASDDALRAGLSSVYWPGRMQRVQLASGQIILLDGAHNPDGAEALRAAIQQEFPQAKPAVIFGVFRDKDSARMCGSLAPLAGRIVLTPVHSDRTADPDTLVFACRQANPHALISVCPSLKAALEKTANEPLVVIAGSLYLVGEAMELLHLAAPPESDEKGLNEWAQSIRPESSVRRRSIAADAGTHGENDARGF